MDETEMTALKKAYAEIILNTAKEAAARVIVSERKADSLQRDLSATKEEAIRILMRLKQMIGFKMNEAETKSLIQQKRIDELEAQLHEAEDIVSSLRAELYETQAELERLSRNQQRPLDNPSHPEESAKPEGTEEQQGSIKNYVTSGVTPLQPQGPQHVSKTDWKGSVSDKNGYGNACYEEHCYAGDAGKTDVTSMIIRSTEPELYRNGCTQRIRACDRNLLNGHLPLSGQPDDLKCEKLVEAENGGERIGVVVPTSGGKETLYKENTPADGKEIINNVKAILRLKRKIALRQKRNRAQLEVEPVLVKQACETRDVSRSLACTSDGSINCSLTETNSDSKANQEPGLEGRLALTIPSAAGTSEKESETHDVFRSLACTSGSFNCSLTETNSDSKANQEPRLEGRLTLTIPSAAGTSEKESDSVAATDKDMELTDAMVLITQESGTKTDIGLPGSEEEQENPTSPLEKSNALASDSTDAIPIQSPKDRIVKYTFQRKRKRESISNGDVNSSPQKDIPEPRTGKGENDALDSLTAESS